MKTYAICTRCLSISQPALDNSVAQFNWYGKCLVRSKASPYEPVGDVEVLEVEEEYYKCNICGEEYEEVPVIQIEDGKIISYPESLTDKIYEMFPYLEVTKEKV